MIFRSSQYPQLLVHFGEGLDERSVRFEDGILETDDADAIKALKALAKNDETIVDETPAKPKAKKPPKAKPEPQPEPTPDAPEGDGAPTADETPADDEAQVTVDEAIADAEAPQE